jgi:DNA-binding transcriptional ArsR family regulator
MNTYRERAEVLRVMAHPIRLRILDILQGDSECVCHLSAALGKPQPYVSQQLAVLRKAGLVIDEKEGTNSFYRLADEVVSRQVKAILGSSQDQPRDGETGCHHAIDGCICPKCRPADVRSLDRQSSPC